MTSWEVNQVEDLSSGLQMALLGVAQGNNYALTLDNFYALEALGLIIYRDMAHNDLTERGQRLVADYQQRHSQTEPAGENPVKPTPKPHLFARIQAILDLTEYYMPGELGEFPERVTRDIQEFRDYKALMDKQAQELQAELAAAKAENERLKSDMAFAADEINNVLQNCNLSPNAINSLNDAFEALTPKSE